MGKSLDEAGFHIYLSTFATLSDNNAAYLPIANSIFILPAWLMAPVYQQGANTAYNFATPCCVIAHEMTHGFDTTGSRYNEYGDLGGFETAFQAYTRQLVANGFKGEGLRLQQRRFYEAFAYFWRAKYTEQYASKQVAGTDPHSLAKERVNGVVSNTEAWYDLFDVKPGDKLYRAPEDRIHIW